MYKKLLIKLAKELDNRDISYMISGGQAVLFYGEPRLTRDIDITTGLKPFEFKKIIDITENLNLKILVDNPSKFIKKTMVLPAMEEDSDIKVDFIFSFSEYEKNALERTNKVEINNYKIKLASLEDIVIHKVISGRPRDIEDINSMLLKNPDYNRNYIESWLSKFEESLNEDFSKVFNNIEKELS